MRGVSAKHAGLNVQDKNHADSVAAIVRITGGKCRLIEPLMSQSPGSWGPNTGD